MNVLENRTAPPKEEDHSAADAAAAAMGYGMIGGLMNDTLMITNAPAGYGSSPLPSCFDSQSAVFSFCQHLFSQPSTGAYGAGAAGYGGSSIPDPYSQPQGYGYGGPAAGGYGGGYGY